ncbi:MAG: hypothetical protein R6U37_01595 [Dehalococcoidia bacterium]
MKQKRVGHMPTLTFRISEGIRSVIEMVQSIRGYGRGNTIRYLILMGFLWHMDLQRRIERNHGEAKRKLLDYRAEVDDMATRGDLSPDLIHELSLGIRKPKRRFIVNEFDKQTLDILLEIANKFKMMQRGNK